MALWGISDSLFSTGTISVNLTTKVATVSSGTLPAADVLEGAVVTITGKGSATIKERTGNTTFTIHNTTGLDGTAISGVAYNISAQPKSAVLDTNYGGDEIFGVDTTEQVLSMLLQVMHVNMHLLMLVGLELHLTQTCTGTSELKQKLL